MENKLGDFIRRVRGDMSLRAFGEMCNLSHSHIDSIEKGYDFRTGKRVSVTTDTIKKISEGTGIDYLTLAALAENIAAPPIGHILHDDGQPHKREIEEIKKEAPSPIQMDKRKARLIEIYDSMPDDESKDKLLQVVVSFERVNKYEIESQYIGGIAAKGGNKPIIKQIPHKDK